MSRQYLTQILEVLVKIKCLEVKEKPKTKISSKISIVKSTKHLCIFTSLNK